MEEENVWLMNRFTEKKLFDAFCISCIKIRKFFTNQSKFKTSIFGSSQYYNRLPFLWINKNIHETKIIVRKISCVKRPRRLQSTEHEDITSFYYNATQRLIIVVYWWTTISKHGLTKIPLSSLYVKISIFLNFQIKVIFSLN